MAWWGFFTLNFFRHPFLCLVCNNELSEMLQENTMLNSQKGLLLFINCDKIVVVHRSRKSEQKTKKKRMVMKLKKLMKVRSLQWGSADSFTKPLQKHLKIGLPRWNMISNKSGEIQQTYTIKYGDTLESDGEGLESMFMCWQPSNIITWIWSICTVLKQQ